MSMQRLSAIFLVFLAVYGTAAQQERREERREQHREKRREQRRRERRRAQPRAGDPWSGVISSGRAIDWTQAGVPGGIPNRTTICATVSPAVPADTTGVTDTAAINQAIQNCTAGGVVQLTAGAFYNSGLSFGTPPKNNVTLRGMGPDQTIIYAVTNFGCAGGFPYFCIGGSSGWNLSYPGSVAWTGGYSQGTNIITLASTTGLQVCSSTLVGNLPASCPSGSIVILDQRNDSIGICPSMGGTGNCAGVSGATESGSTVTIATTLPHAFSVNDCVGVGGISQQITIPATVASWASNVATISFAAAHSLTAGSTIVVSGISGYNGTYTIASVPSATTLTFALTTQPPAYTSGGTVTGTPTYSTPFPGSGLTVMGATWASNVATLTVSPAVSSANWVGNNGWAIGNNVKVSGIPGYNGIFTITSVPSTTTFTYALTTAPPAYASGGNVVGVGYNSGQNPTASCGGVAGKFQITAVPSANSFQYTAPVSGLPNGGSRSANYTGSAQATKDTGGVFISEASDVVVNENSTQGRVCPDTNAGNQCQSPEISQRSQIEIKRVMDICGGGTWQVAGGACTANTIRIDPPLEMTNWRSAQNPGVWWTGNYAVGDGVENLTNSICGVMNPTTLVCTTAPYNSSRVGLMLANSYGCWVKNVRSLYGHRDHIYLVTSLHDAVVDGYYFGTAGGASQSYGVEIYNGNSDHLVQNNICQHVVTCTMSGGENGTVYGHNFSFDTGYTNTIFSSVGLMSVNHDYAAMVLAEGNNTNFIQADNVHGVSTFPTLFRNRLRGQDTPYRSNTQLLRSVEFNSFNRAANVVGNILGISATDTPNLFCTGTMSRCIYRAGMQATGWNVPSDQVTVDTLLRWGNYDIVTGVTQWNASEIPTAALPYISGNAIPGTQTLPASFYLGGQPSFWQTTWGTPAWPAIGPDVMASGTLNTTCSSFATNPQVCDGIGNHAYQIPAQICYNNTPIDQSYQHSWTVTAAQWSSGYVTLTLGTHPLAGGDTVTITGVTPAAFNGIYSVCNGSGGCPSPTATAISYPMATTPGTYQGGGTITWPNMLNYSAAACYPVAYGGTPVTPTTPSGIIGNGQITGQGKIT